MSIVLKRLTSNEASDGAVDGGIGATGAGARGTGAEILVMGEEEDTAFGGTLVASII